MHLLIYRLMDRNMMQLGDVDKEEGPLDVDNNDEEKFKETETIEQYLNDDGICTV